MSVVIWVAVAAGILCGAGFYLWAVVYTTPLAFIAWGGKGWRRYRRERSGR